jgi:hypothetical protein
MRLPEKSIARYLSFSGVNFRIDAGFMRRFVKSLNKTPIIPSRNVRLRQA